MAKKLSHGDYLVGWICPLEVEQIAAMEMLDEEHEGLGQSPADHNVYSLGSINGHNVVIAGLHVTGNCPTATVVAQMRMTFPSLRFGLLVGIGGGVPVQTDEGMIRLGHVVVSKPTGVHSGAVQYDHGKARDGNFERTGIITPAPAVLLNAAQALAVQRARIEEDPVQANVNRIDTSRRRLRRFKYPGAGNDRLYQAEYLHIQPGVSCEDAGCEASHRITRDVDDDDGKFVVVHRGTIASGELVMKDAELRDRLARQHGLLSFEMEAAGALTDFPFLVVRGISDYCDSHKNDVWHGYAAAAAAAYARQLFFHMPVDEIRGEPDDRAASPVSEAVAPVENFQLTIELKEAAQVNSFVGREKELLQMHSALDWTKTRRTVVLHGIAGIGKTQLAAAYLKSYKDEYSAILWLDAKDESSLKKGFACLASRILGEHPHLSYIRNAIDARDVSKVVAAVNRWLEEPMNNRWIAVYDDCGHIAAKAREVNKKSKALSVRSRKAEAPASFDIHSYLPKAQQGAIIVTTQSTSISMGKSIPVLALKDINDMVAILGSRTNHAVYQDPDAEKLLQRLGGFPISLATAGAYMDDAFVSCADYLQLHGESWIQLQKLSLQLPPYNQFIFKSWAASYSRVEEENQNSAKLLRLWAYLDNEDLWYDLLQKPEEKQPKWLLEVTQNKLSFEKTMRVLCKHGFAEAAPPSKQRGGESQGYTLHECVHSWMKHVYEAEPDKDLFAAALTCVGNHVPSRRRPQRGEYWWVEWRLLRHADRCRERLKDVRIPSEMESRMCMALGSLYIIHNRLQEAEDMCTRARKAHAAVKSGKADRTFKLEWLIRMGQLRATQRRLDEAESLLTKAISGWEKSSKPEDEAAFDAAFSLAYVHRKQERKQEARVANEKALRGYEKVCKTNRLSVYRAALDLGAICYDMGDLATADTLFIRAIGGFERIFGHSHLDTILALTARCALLSHRGKQEEADLMVPRIMKGYEKALGSDMAPTNSKLLDALWLWNWFCEGRGMMDDALNCLLRIQSGLEVAFGSQNPRYVQTAERVASLQSAIAKRNLGFETDQAEKSSVYTLAGVKWAR